MSPEQDNEPISPPSPAEKHPAANKQRDDEVAAITRTIEPKSDAHSRSGIMGSGSGADTQKT